MVKVKTDAHAEDHKCADYLRKFIELPKLERQIRYACKVLRTFDFDAIAFTGVSGMLIGPIIALRLKKPMIVVRKGKLSDCHSSCRVEGFTAAKRYVIVDDFVASGDTVRKIHDAVKKFSPEAKLIGTLEVRRLDERKVKEFLAGRRLNQTVVKVDHI